MVTVFFYLHIFTGSVEKRILIVVPVDTLYRTSIISSSTVLLLNPFANLSLAPLFLFSIYGPDLGVWPDCWVSAEFLRAPIPRKGSGSTTTTTTMHNFPFWLQQDLRSIYQFWKQPTSIPYSLFSAVKRNSFIHSKFHINFFSLFRRNRNNIFPPIKLAE